MTQSRTDALLETLRYAPRRVITEKLAEHAYRLEDELQQANDSYAALAAVFEHFMKGQSNERLRVVCAEGHWVFGFDWLRRLAAKFRVAVMGAGANAVVDGTGMKAK